MTQRTPVADLMRLLAAIGPATKSARLRLVLPVIEQQLAAGVRIADMLEVLREHGLELTMATFKSYLYRFRHARKTTTGKRVAGRCVAWVADPPAQPPALAGLQDTTHSGTGHDAALPRPGRPVSMRDLDQIMRADPAALPDALAHYERVARLRLRQTDPEGSSPLCTPAGGQRDVKRREITQRRK